MIVFVEEGRLGNQLFQYAALATLAKIWNERLILIGFDDLSNVFTGVRGTIVSPRGLTLGGVIKVLRRLLNFAVPRSRLVRVISEERSKSIPVIEVKKGVFETVAYCHDSFFQSEDFFSRDVIEDLFIRQSLRMKADAAFSRIGDSQRPRFFVHIRRGDYLTWPSTDYPAVLPLGWYLRQMAWMRKRYDRPLFLVFSDDMRFAERVAATAPDAYACHEASDVTFSMMSACNGGVLSASTFAWWAAYFAYHGSGRDTKAFRAPFYWAGHRKEDWYPVGIRSSFLGYDRVRKSDWTVG